MELELHFDHLVIGGSVVEGGFTEIVKDVSCEESKLVNPFGVFPLDFVEVHHDGSSEARQGVTVDETSVYTTQERSHKAQKTS